MTAGMVIREAHFPGRAPIEAYGNGGFRFADMSHRGSLLCLPSGIHGWEPADPLALTAADFGLLLAEAGKVEILLVGTGKDLRPLPAALRAALKAAGIGSDPDSARRSGSSEGLPWQRLRRIATVSKFANSVFIAADDLSSRVCPSTFMRAR